jgi:hypothetical protein
VGLQERWIVEPEIGDPGEGASDAPALSSQPIRAW